MKADIKQRWLDRLESGEIKQTRKVLGRSDGSRCCLGVLCDIAVEDGIIYPPSVHEYEQGEEALYYGENEYAELPVEVYEWAGLPDGDPKYGRMIPGLGRQSSLAHLNDVSRYNFKKIAAVVRKNF